ncbi:MAG: vanadium-dependent haloperoxidase, partial [Pseudomonadota bacterium]
ENGLVKDPQDPVRLRAAMDSGYTRDFDLNVPLGCRDDDGKLEWKFYPEATDDDPGTGHRKWEAPTAGFVYDLQGPDAQAVTMPPAPPIVAQKKTKPGHGYYREVASIHAIEANPELVAEMSEVYWLALLRDKPLAALDDRTANPADTDIQAAVDHLAALHFYEKARGKHPRRRLLDHYDGLSRQNVFRGHTPGDRKGPYLSQFMLMGDRHLNKTTPSGRVEEDGLLQYGSITIDQRVRTALPERDYMTHWNEWLDVQNGADVIDRQVYVDSGSADPLPFRFIATLRDLATYVHFDALYEAYLNACIWLLNTKAPFDPQFRHLLAGTKHTTGFALFGGPHILSLMTEVATRGLKAVRFQKFNAHLRLRPEALAGLVAAEDAGVLGSLGVNHVDLFHDELDGGSGGVDLLQKVRDHNEAQNNANHDSYLTGLPATEVLAKTRTLPLLPMAFPEGSPMHPSYGAGHATVAGACVTILKAFFDEDACLVRRGGVVMALPPGDVDPATDERVAFVAEADGSAIDNKGSEFPDYLRVGDELNKLAANISIARNMAGVHYYSDYIDSLRMGEEIAIGILQEQSIMYPKDPFRVSLTSFDGKRIIIGEGEVQCLDPETGHDYDHIDTDALLAKLGYTRDQFIKYAANAEDDKSAAD